MAEQRSTVVVVGGGFAGVGCATRLARHDVAVTLLDRNNYHQFQPLLYQVATAELAVVDVARPLRGIFARHPSVRVKRVDVVSVDVDGRSVTTADGDTFGGDYLVLAAGSKPNFFNTPGAQQHAFPLYSVADANRLRNRLFEVFEDADNDATLIDRGALNIVVVGAGPTGVETAGAMADLVNDVMPKRYRDLDLDRVAITIVDLGPAVLGPFSDTASAYATKRLGTLGVNLRLKTGVEEVTAEGVLLSDGTEIASRTVVWAGGITAPDLAAASGLDAGRGGRLTAQPDLTVDGHPSVYAIGDMANMTDDTGQALPQLGSVALQAGRWAARNILADVDGRQREPFRYRDKGIMAMVGRGSAVAEVGKRHHELHGTVAFAAWLGVHAWLMSGVRQRVDAFVSWAWDFLGASRGDAVIETDSARIDWGDQDPTDESP
ncbi:NAD(P)/FAD-dependent oxidoreductase [Candidatus Microthrix sp.]|jgi:NADH dehydrogenase|uniref:NAD(P)/FAD-dependent oxidoreductase n=1 Tax=Candidatus Neomicrothrix sp. TaxID=2719034 RepID=UPI0025917D53|nr:NAD(P)/FAD-dependent oxidoreductase [Candidatus Microthrix sp.]HMS48363.1 NAD(P)/FAD-dependent oxidoreductase [Candidatus Microthrix sp.]